MTAQARLMEERKLFRKNRVRTRRSLSGVHAGPAPSMPTGVRFHASLPSPLPLLASPPPLPLINAPSLLGSLQG